MANDDDHHLHPLTIIQLTAGLQRALEHEVQEQNQMSRLRDKLTQAKGVVARVASDIEAAADDLIARENQLRDMKNNAFGAHIAIINDAKAGLDDLERELGQFSNGGPPLDSTSTASAGPSENPTKPQP